MSSVTKVAQAFIHWSISYQWDFGFPVPELCLSFENLPPFTVARKGTHIINARATLCWYKRARYEFSGSTAGWLKMNFCNSDEGERRPPKIH